MADEGLGLSLLIAEAFEVLIVYLLTRVIPFGPIMDDHDACSAESFHMHHFVLLHNKLSSTVVTLALFCPWEQSCYPGGERMRGRGRTIVAMVLWWGAYEGTGETIVAMVP